MYYYIKYINAVYKAYYVEYILRYIMQNMCMCNMCCTLYFISMSNIL